MIQFEERMEKEKETQNAKTPRKNRENYKKADVFIPEDFKSQNKELFKICAITSNVCFIIVHHYRRNNGYFYILFL